MYYILVRNATDGAWNTAGNNEDGYSTMAKAVNELRGWEDDDNVEEGDEYMIVSAEKLFAVRKALEEAKD